ncbi:MAG: carboxypeptidase regulatory-like domain-containing protein [Pirellulales bacterium]|nr:carboxypeptidase regulatory-like domain-containing protein [Pirellulales bacterium]
MKCPAVVCRRWCWIACLLCFTVFVSGCNDPGYDVSRVSGRVTLNSKPLAGATVSFQPIASPNAVNPGPGSFGRTDEQGRFSLSLVSSKKNLGAVVGKHRVTISIPGVLDREMTGKVLHDPNNLIPRKFQDGSVTFDVPETGTDQANFDLSSK